MKAAFINILIQTKLSRISTDLKALDKSEIPINFEADFSITKVYDFYYSDIDAFNVLSVSTISFGTQSIVLSYYSIFFLAIQSGKTFGTEYYCMTEDGLNSKT